MRPHTSEAAIRCQSPAIRRSSLPPVATWWRCFDLSRPERGCGCPVQPNTSCQGPAMHRHRTYTSGGICPRVRSSDVHNMVNNRCQHQRTKKEGQSRRKSGKSRKARKHKLTTKRRSRQHTMKCTLRRCVVFLSPPECATGTAVYRVDAACI